jgi:arginase
MLQFALVDAPSNLGLWPSGVETLGIALKSAGLATRLGMTYGGRLEPPPFSPERDPQTHIRNGAAIAAYSSHLATRVAHIVQDDRFAIVLGGDCSILIGVMLGLRRLGRYGLLFVDGHADFYQPDVEAHGEVASMELAIVTGRGPTILTNIEGLQPLVRDTDVVAFGYRDEAIQRREGSQDIRQSGIATVDINQVRDPSVVEVAQRAVTRLLDSQLDGFWIHLDADVLDDAVMPAVDYRTPGGLQWDEVSTLLHIAIASGRARGMTVTIFNPTLDDDGAIAQQFVECIVRGLQNGLQGGLKEEQRC